MKPKSTVKTFKDLIVWQRAFQLCLEVYKATKVFPADERFGMTAEMRKTSRSIVYNISEGQKRRSTADFLRFLGISSGSGGELETQLLLARDLGYLEDREAALLIDRYEEVERLLDGLMRSLERKLK